eukprot:gene9940-10960_t
MGKRNKTGLGNALIRNKSADKVFSTTAKHTTEVYSPSGKPDLKSVTEETALNEFIATAELANREFTAEKVNATTIVTEAHIPGLPTDEELDKVIQYQQSNKKFLIIPRRPNWDESTTPEQLEHAERESFLQWRRQLALLGEKDEKIILTPYEKNIDVWRQLWRVIERSDVICQIVDGRNPLLFKCDDLECYVKEVDEAKENIILVNKADYLTEKQRKYWAEYFEARNTKVVFWSALMASIQQTDDEVEVRDSSAAGKGLPIENEASRECQNEDEEQSRDDDITENEQNDEEMETTSSGGDVQVTDCEDGVEKYAILSREQLLNYFESFRKNTDTDKSRSVIGMVGFPNVGKSSTINALIGDKKTSVSSTPGKTKHFQTINIGDSICLCDCPGLVYPTFISTKAALILNGVLPVDQLRDYRPPVTLLCKWMPRGILEKTYGINIVKPGEAENPNRPPTADEFLSAYSSMRGFMTSHGLPDCSRGARHVIKDFLKGKLLYCEPTPDVPVDDFEPVQDASLKFQERKYALNRQSSGISSSTIDREFFNEPQSGVHYNAPTGMRGERNPASSEEPAGKPWKKHFNRGKKEKLRRIVR